MDEKIHSKPDHRGEGQYLQTLLAHWIHEDNLYWSQVRHLLVIEFAALASWYGLGPTNLSVAVMILAALICWLLFRLAAQIALNRDANSFAIQLVARNLMSSETEAALREKLGKVQAFRGLFRYATHELTETKDVGRRFQRSVFGLCVALNFSVALATFADVQYCSAFFAKLHPHLSVKGCK